MANIPTDRKTDIDWKLILPILSILIAVFVVFYGNGLCNQASPPPWTAPLLSRFCPATSSPTTDSIAGLWTGTVYNNANPGIPWEFSVTILAGCRVGQVCGTASAPQVPCLVDLTLTSIKQDLFIFSETWKGGLDTCPRNNFEFMSLVSPSQLSLSTGPNSDPAGADVHGILSKQ